MNFKHIYSTLLYSTLLYSTLLYSADSSKQSVYLDVRLNYLSGKGVATLGSADNTNDSKIELLIALLGNDGNYATQDSSGHDLSSIAIMRGSEDLLSANSIYGGNASRDNLLVTPRSLEREIKPNRNIRRVIIDYKDFVTSTFEDTQQFKDVLTIEAGGLQKRITIDLMPVQAKGLIVRTAHENKLEHKVYDENSSHKVFNALVTELKTVFKGNYDGYKQSAPSEADLAVQSRSVIGGTAGKKIAIAVYAISTDTLNNARLTPLQLKEGEQITVRALADYDKDGKATTKLGGLRLSKIENGVATGEITINQALYGTAHGDFNDGANGGLGITFLAYVQHDMSINNTGSNILDINDKTTFNEATDPSSNLTDIVTMDSRGMNKLRLGRINVNGDDLRDLWRDTNSRLYFVDTNISSKQRGLYYDRTHSYNDINGKTRHQLYVTAIDSKGNPVDMRTFGNNINAAKFFDAKGENNSSRFRVGMTDGVNSDYTRDMTGGTTITERTTSIIEINTTFDHARYTDKEGNIVNDGEGKETVKIEDSGGATLNLSLVSYEPRRNIVKGYLEDILPFTTITHTATKKDEAGIIAGADYDKDNKSYQDLTANIKILDSNDSGVAILTIAINNPDDEDSEVLKDLKIYHNEYMDSDYWELNSTATFDDGIYKITLRDSNDTGTQATSRLDINISATEGLGSIIFSNTAFRDPQSKGKSLQVTFRAYEGRKIPAFANISIDTTEDDPPTDKDKAIPVGSAVKFDFSGDAVNTRDKVVIVFETNSSGAFKEAGQVGLADEYGDANWHKDLTHKIETKMPEDRELTVYLYDVNMSNNKPEGTINGGGRTAYRIKSLTLNTIPMIWANIANDEETKDTY